MSQVKVGEIELCYRSEGQGEPLLLVMGLGAQLIMWPDDFCRALVRRGFRVIRFDNRDAGESSRLDHLGTPGSSTSCGAGPWAGPSRRPTRWRPWPTTPRACCGRSTCRGPT